MDPLELFPWKPIEEGAGELCADDFLEHPIVFVERFWKWRDSLFVLACRVLGEVRPATEAVEACFRVACQKPPKFESDGEFGRWLLRILLDEALQIRAKKRRAPKAHSNQALARASAWSAVHDDFDCLATAI